MANILQMYSPLLRRIDGLMEQKERVILAIDGNSAAGKSSLAGVLKSAYGCNVFSMDDFFLQPLQRTLARLDEPGGNVDYERFGEEIIKPLLSGEPFAYRPYDCGTQTLSPPRGVTPSRLNIVEGVYSMHPRFADAYDIRVFLRISAAEQRRRLTERNADLLDRFLDEWIPMESKYFNAFHIIDKCDLVFDTGSFTMQPG